MQPMQSFGLSNLELIDPCLIASEGKKDFIWAACERDMAAGTYAMQNMQYRPLQNLATVYTTEQSNYGFDQTGSSTSSSTSKSDVQTSSTSTSTTTYTPGLLERIFSGFGKKLEEPKAEPKVYVLVEEPELQYLA